MNLVIIELIFLFVFVLVLVFVAAQNGKPEVVQFWYEG